MTNSMTAVMILATKRAVGLADAVHVTAREISDGRFDIHMPLAAAQHTGLVAWAGNGARARAQEQIARERAGRLATIEAGSPVTYGEAAMLGRRTGCGQMVSIIVNVDYPEQVKQATREWRAESKRRTAWDGMPATGGFSAGRD